MYLQAVNGKGDGLYIVTFSQTNELGAHVSLKTWEEATKYFQNITTEQDNDTWFVKVVKKRVQENYLEATVVRNHIGWGPDYLVKVVVERAMIY